MNYSNNLIWLKSVDEDLYTEAGEKNIVQVSDGDYVQSMEQQNKRVLYFLREKYPERTFRLSPWHSHEFGKYQEVEEKIRYDDEEEDLLE